MRKSVSWLACVIAIAIGVTPTFAQVSAEAEVLYQRAEYDASLSLLDKHSSDPATMFLVGRDYYMVADFKKATAYFQRASAAEPNNSEYADWLGRAWGKRAETATPMLAPVLASKARQAFERAVDLNPKNPQALDDLFSYYLDAPGILGGGYEKAFSVAEKISVIDPADGYFAQAQLQERRQEYRSAERLLRESLALAPLQVDRLIELARILANQGRTRDSDAVFAQAQKINPNAPKLWFARADVLIQQNRNLSEARLLLKKYLRAVTTVNDPPKEEAARLLHQAGGV